MLSKHEMFEDIGGNVTSKQGQEVESVSCQENNVGQFRQALIRKNFKLSKYEDIIYYFKARGLVISNIQLHSRNIQIRDFMNTLRNFAKSVSAHVLAKSVFAHIFAKFEYLTLQGLSLTFGLSQGYCPRVFLMCIHYRKP